MFRIKNERQDNNVRILLIISRVYIIIFIPKITNISWLMMRCGKNIVSFQSRVKMEEMWTVTKETSRNRKRIEMTPHNTQRYKDRM